MLMLKQFRLKIIGVQNKYLSDLVWHWATTCIKMWKLDPPLKFVLSQRHTKFDMKKDIMLYKKTINHKYRKFVFKVIWNIINDEIQFYIIHYYSLVYPTNVFYFGKLKDHLKPSSPSPPPNPWRGTWTGLVLVYNPIYWHKVFTLIFYNKNIQGYVIWLL